MATGMTSPVAVLRDAASRAPPILWGIGLQRIIQISEIKMLKLARTDAPTAEEYATVHVAFELSKAKVEARRNVAGLGKDEPRYDSRRRLGGADGTFCGGARRLQGPASRCGSCRDTMRALMGTGCVAGSPNKG